jgi:hypothetical protein
MAPQQIIYRLPQCQQMAVRQPIPEGYLVQKKAELMQDILNMVFSQRATLPYKGVLFRTKVFNRSWISTKWFRIADAAGNLMVRM